MSGVVLSVPTDTQGIPHGVKVVNSNTWLLDPQPTLFCGKTKSLSANEDVNALLGLPCFSIRAAHELVVDGCIQDAGQL